MTLKHGKRNEVLYPTKWILQLIVLCNFLLGTKGQVFSAQEKTDILNAHNSARAAVNPPASNMGTMVWNTTLESWAQSWVNGCQNTDSNTAILDHSPSNLRPGAGENIYASSGTALGPDAVNSWNSEKQYYDYATNYCNGQLYTATSPVWGYCGHYTQIAWATSVQLGCARNYCSNIQYGYTIVCNYSPPGNYYGGSNSEFYRPYQTPAAGASPSVTPSRTPSTSPAAASSSPTRTPSPSPAAASSSPTRTPSPSTTPSVTPSRTPSTSPSISSSPSPAAASSSPTRTPSPSTTPSVTPSRTPSTSPSVSSSPGASPTSTPTRTPSPSTTPSTTPSRTPSTSPAAPSSSPTGTPSSTPSRTPSSSPTSSPGSPPTSSPSLGYTPSTSPSSTPSPSTGAQSSPTPGAGNGGKKKDNSMVVIAGAAGGGALLLIGGAVAAFVLVRRNKNAYKPSYYENAPSAPSSSPAYPTNNTTTDVPMKTIPVMSTTDIQRTKMAQPGQTISTANFPSQTAPKPPIPSQPVPKPPVNNNNPFPVGSNCMAKYTGDGQYYKAVVKQYNPSQGYLVSYPDYGSEEWLPVSSLKK